jgi:hypothetical protein
LRLLELVYRARGKRRIPPGTARLIAPVEVVSMILWEKKTWAVAGIDIRRSRPRVRLLKGAELDADCCEAFPHPRRAVRSGAQGRYRIPGPECSSALLPPDSEVTAVVSWRDLGGSVFVLARWVVDEQHVFGVFDAEDLIALE